MIQSAKPALHKDLPNGKLIKQMKNNLLGNLCWQFDLQYVETHQFLIAQAPTHTDLGQNCGLCMGNMFNKGWCNAIVYNVCIFTKN
jgi:hypothetical protein